VPYSIKFVKKTRNSFLCVLCGERIEFLGYGIESTLSTLPKINTEALYEKGDGIDYSCQIVNDS